MCILPSRTEFDELEVQNRKYEKELEAKLVDLPEAQRQVKRQEMLRLSVLRFAGALAVMGCH